jgi:hypothetical protein
MLSYSFEWSSFYIVVLTGHMVSFLIATIQYEIELINVFWSKHRMQCRPLVHGISSDNNDQTNCEEASLSQLLQVPSPPSLSIISPKGRKRERDKGNVSRLF